MKNEIISILMCRDDMTREEAINIIEETRDEIACAIENGAGLDEIEIRATSLTPLGEINLPFVATDAFIPRRHWHKPWLLVIRTLLRANGQWPIANSISRVYR